MADLGCLGDGKLGRLVCVVSKGLQNEVGRRPLSSMPLPRGLPLFAA